jgi:antitoxin Xre/MbcA/ParS-like protein
MPALNTGSRSPLPNLDKYDPLERRRGSVLHYDENFESLWEYDFEKTESEDETMQTIDNNARRGHVALKGFFKIGERWGCSDEELKQLLGGISETTLKHYQTLPNEELPKSVLLRVSYVMGIYRAVGTLFQNPNQGHRHVRRPSNADPFNGSSALNYMLIGTEESLEKTRRYFDYCLWN